MRRLCVGVPAASSAARFALHHRSRWTATTGLGQSSRLRQSHSSKPCPRSSRFGFGKRRLSALASAARDQTDPTDGGEPSGLFRLLTEEQRILLQEQRDIVRRARDVAVQVGGVEVRDCLGGLGVLGDVLSSSGGERRNSSESRIGEGGSAIDSTFAVVVAGEFNAGKSTIMNALLGEKLLETGALPTTDAVTVLAYDPTFADSTGAAATVGHPGIMTTTTRPGVTLHRHPSPLLRDLTLIDTPGTNAVHADHTARTTKLLPVADLILFVTTADRPFPESERALLKSIQSFRKNVIIVLNKMDVLESSGGNHGQAEKDRVAAFVAEHASELLGARPVVLPVSARDALGAKLVSTCSGGGGGGWSGTSTWHRSNFAQLEEFLSTTLTDEAKIRSKLLNPLGVAERMLDDCLGRLGARKAELDADVATLRLLESQMGGWTVEMEGDLGAFRRNVCDALRAEGGRCRAVVQRMRYVDQWRWTVLGDGEEFREQWSRARLGPVSAGAGSVEAEVLDLVRESADHVATRARAQGQAVIEYLGKRPAVTSQSLVGSVTAASRFEDTRKELSEKMSQSARAIFVSYDPSAECDEALRSMRWTVVASGALHAGALTLGAMALDTILDTTAVGAAASMSTVALLGIALIPYRNKQVATAFEERWKARSERLDSSLEGLFKKEMEKIERRINASVAPYTRYVRTELDRAERLTSECEDLVAGAHSLRSRINKLTALGTE